MDADELLDRPSARARLTDADDDTLALPEDRPLVVVCDATNADEASGLSKIADALGRALGDSAPVKTVTFETTWPLLRLHLGIDMILGAGGYNTVHEARLTGTPLRAIPRQRLYDRQDRRLVPAELLDDKDWPDPVLRSTCHAIYTNGAHGAIEEIEALVS